MAGTVREVVQVLTQWVWHPLKKWFRGDETVMKFILYDSRINPMQEAARVKLYCQQGGFLRAEGLTCCGRPAETIWGRWTSTHLDTELILHWFSSQEPELETWRMTFLALSYSPVYRCLPPDQTYYLLPMDSDLQC